ncbi:MAG TPA: hypothetical protein VHB02_06025 [Acidimicrobiales bacterium]|nr:hypothetical protein [Acidimicrobiales bacterium]
MTTGYAALKDKKSQLIRKGLQASVFVATRTADIITKAVLFDDTGDLQPLPAGWEDYGLTDTTGAKMPRSVKSSTVTSCGETEPTRSDFTQDTTTLTVVPQETKRLTVATYTGADPSALVAGSNGAVELKRATLSTARYCQLLSVAVDTTDDGEIVIARYLPKAKVTDFADQSHSSGDDPLLWGVTFTAFKDEALGFAVDDLFGGPGWNALLIDMGFRRIVTCSTTSTDATLTATTGTFVPSDMGKPLSGAGIPATTTVATYTDDTHVEMSHAATATASNVAVTVG